MYLCRREFLTGFSRLAAIPASRLVGNGRKADLWPTVFDDQKHNDIGLNNLREQFPLLNERVEGRALIYLDSAATTQRPRAVLRALSDFYAHENANPARNLHSLARRSAAEYDKARDRLARFINAPGPEEIVFTRGTTEAINLVAYSWGGANLRARDEILVTVAEHYSNLVPWQLAAQRANASLRILDIEDDGRLRLNQLETLLSERTKLVALAHVSNVLGLVNPVRQICERAHRAGALVLVDGAQSIPHFPIDVQELGCDFFAFSGHKMFGPMGIGVLWARRGILEKMPPFQAGSNMLHDVDLASASFHFADAALKFEAGTPNVPGAVGLAAAMEFIDTLGRKALWEREQELTRYALPRFEGVKGLRILGPTQAKERISLFSFVLENREPLDIVKALNIAGIAVRGGDLASRPLLKRLGLSLAVRASCYAYTSFEEIDRLVAALQRIVRGSSA